MGQVYGRKGIKMTENTQPEYTKADVQELIRQFEGMVRALATVFNEEQLVKFVALILNNHIQDGKFTDEYLHYSRQALDMRKRMGEELNSAQGIILNGFAPAPFNPVPKKF